MTKGKKCLITGVFLMALFILLTVLVQTVDVRPAGVNGTHIGFAGFNGWFHQITNVNMTVYAITDWLGLVPIAVCLFFGIIGLIQLINRKSLLKIDRDILYLGIYYVIVIIGYLVFEMIPINYRPVLIDGKMEASYPSSTTLLVLSVMPTLIFQAKRRVKKEFLRLTTVFVTVIFTAFMIIGRMTCGVHWFTDILGAVLLSGGIFSSYKAAVYSYYDNNRGVIF